MDETLLATLYPIWICNPGFMDTVLVAQRST
jgi:hypothetical protein